MSLTTIVKKKQQHGKFNGICNLMFFKGFEAKTQKKKKEILKGSLTKSNLLKTTNIKPNTPPKSTTKTKSNLTQKSNVKHNYITIPHPLKNKSFPTFKPLHRQIQWQQQYTHTFTPIISINDKHLKLTLIPIHHRWSNLKTIP